MFLPSQSFQEIITEFLRRGRARMAGDESGGIAPSGGIEHPVITNSFGVAMASGPFLRWLRPLRL